MRERERESSVCVCYLDFTLVSGLEMLFARYFYFTLVSGLEMLFASYLDFTLVSDIGFDSDAVLHDNEILHVHTGRMTRHIKPSKSAQPLARLY